MKVDEPFLSICVPTSNRPQLAKSLLLSLLPQIDYRTEIVVLENSDNPELSDFEELKNTQIKIYSTDQVLPMCDNWQRGLEVSSGKYVTYLSDKDVVLPGALSYFIQLLSELGEPDCLSYPKAWFDAEAGVLHNYRQSDAVVRCLSDKFFRYWFDRAMHIHTAPMIYTSFYKKSLFDRQSKVSPFFGFNPDVCSAVFMLAQTTSFFQGSKVFSVANVGSESIGKSSERLGPRAPGILAYHGAKPDIEREERRSKLPRTVSASVILDLLLGKELLGTLGTFVDCNINWPHALRVIISEVDRWEIPRQEKILELSKLGQESCPVPKSALVELLFNYKTALNPPISDPRGDVVLPLFEKCKDIHEALELIKR